MRIVVDTRQMQECDRNTIEQFHVPSIVLMERAALAVKEQIAKRNPLERVLVVCGNGNNGADGLVLARLLWEEGVPVTVCQPNARDKGCRRTKENLLQREILGACGIEILESIPEGSFMVVVDALFGIGLSREPEGIYAELIREMNQLGAYKVAVDIPSGVSSQDGSLYRVYFQADLTVTFAYEKLGQLLYPGCEACGEVVISQIGITDQSWLDGSPSYFCMEKPDLVHLPKRPAYSNKGTFGKVLVVAGSKGMAGAAYFCAKAAYRTGCGLVKILTAPQNREILQTKLPEAILAASGKEDWPDSLRDAMEWASVIVIGPGLGTKKRAKKLVEEVCRNSKKPLVIDADALNILSLEPRILEGIRVPVVVTPHLGEMARLTGGSIEEIQGSLLETAKAFAKRYQVTCVLKDARTLVATPDQRVIINTSGCSGLAKGGSGDVLAGMIAGLAAQGLPMEQAAALGVYWHGLSAEAIAGRDSEYSITASGLLDSIGPTLARSMQELGQSKHERKRGKNIEWI